MKYVLWDWNGTLFNDVTAGLNAANAMLRRRGIPEISMERYRASFGFPVRNFYTAVGFRLEEEDWDAMAVEYHDLLRGDPSQRLREGALDALELVKSAGAGQSVISALRQDMLDAGWEENGFESDGKDLFIHMINGNFQYNVSFGDAVKLPEGDEPIAYAGAKIVSVTFAGPSYHFTVE